MRACMHNIQQLAWSISISAPLGIGSMRYSRTIGQSSIKAEESLLAKNRIKVAEKLMRCDPLERFLSH